MVQANIDNEPISIQLNSDGTESTTVPAGEVWKVSITVEQSAQLRINSLLVVDNDSQNPTFTTETVVVGGDTIEAYGASGGLQIGGFVVSS